MPLCVEAILPTCIVLYLSALDLVFGFCLSATYVKPCTGTLTFAPQAVDLCSTKFINLTIRIIARENISSSSVTADVASVAEKVGQKGLPSQSRCFCVSYSQKSLEDITDVRWKTVDQFLKETDLQTGSESLDDYDLKTTAEELHVVADSLPSSGTVVDVYLWPPKDPEKRDYIQFLGALRRLKDWHNARVVVFESDPSPDTEFLQKFLSSDVIVDVESFYAFKDKLMWRGKVSVCDKIENKGLLVPGVSMQKIDEETPELRFPILDQNQEGCYLGRMFEVLDEVSLSSVPTIMKTPHVYKLCLYQKHPYSQVLMNYIQENSQTGMLARLPVYPGQEEQPSCAEVGLSTEAWKENIVADIQFVQEPEEDLQDNYEFLYFIITSPDENETFESFVAYAYLLQHPYHLNGDLVHTMYDSAICPVRGGNDTEVDMSDLPLMSWETLRNVAADIVSLQQTMLERLAETKQARNEAAEVEPEELAALLADVRLKYFTKLNEKLKGSETFKDIPDKWRLNVKKELSDVSETPAEWPERLALEYIESQKRSLSRVQSTESMPMSSPLQPCEATNSIDIQSFLKFFQPDGSASATNMSPIHRRHLSRTKGKLSSPDTASPQQTSWPESKDIISHDVYYNVDRKSEKVNRHLNRLQEKYVKEETYSSCRSPVCLFPRATKKRSPKQEQGLRRSPRKKNPRSVFDENVPGYASDVKATRGGAKLLEFGSKPEKESRRRFSTPHGQSAPRSSSVSSKDLSTQRRRSEIGLSKVPQPKQVEKLRRVSDVGSSFITPEGDDMKKESRSQRHRRRLQDIVDRVLVDNGVSKTDPIYKSCSSRLFKVTKLFVMDLPNSRNLRDEMQKIAENQVKQVIDVDRSRQESSQRGKQKKSV